MDTQTIIKHGQVWAANGTPKRVYFNEKEISALVGRPFKFLTRRDRVYYDLINKCWEIAGEAHSALDLVIAKLGEIETAAAAEIAAAEAAQAAELEAEATADDEPSGEVWDVVIVEAEGSDVLTSPRMRGFIEGMCCHGSYMGFSADVHPLAQGYVFSDEAFAVEFGERVTDRLPEGSSVQVWGIADV